MPRLLIIQYWAMSNTDELKNNQYQLINNIMLKFHEYLDLTYQEYNGKNGDFILEWIHTECEFAQTMQLFVNIVQEMFFTGKTMN